MACCRGLSRACTSTHSSISAPIVVLWFCTLHTTHRASRSITVTASASAANGHVPCCRYCDPDYPCAVFEFRVTSHITLNAKHAVKAAIRGFGLGYTLIVSGLADVSYMMCTCVSLA